MKNRLILSIIVTSVILFGCNKDQEEDNNDFLNENVIEKESEEENENEKDNEENLVDHNKDEQQDTSFFDSLPDVPTDTAGFIHQKVGLFSGISLSNEGDMDEILNELYKVEPLPEDASDEQLDNLFKYMYSLAAEDYPNPEDTIKKWEFGAFGDPDLPDSRFHFKENYNIEVLLDASGSMGAYIGDKTMMQIAKETINEFLKAVPEDANVSFRVYGHVGKGTSEDKEKSCAAIEQVYGFEPYDEAKFQKELNKIEPAGWTPLAEAMKQSEEALSKFDPTTNTNLMYVVSDGIETCGGDPIQVAETLKNSTAEPIINIIGFNMDADERVQLEEVAKVSGGIFAPANNQEELKAEFERAEKVVEAWDRWKKDSLRSAKFQETSNSFDIREVSNDWAFSTRRLGNNLSTLGVVLRDEGFITRGQQEKLVERRHKVVDQLKEIRKEIEQLLRDISSEKINDLKREIEERYGRETKN